eukprot:TRINITY_DN53610_c0_g1_i1.p1 TRINITY_DN53610_c0_g1~~TRINITY_DN53610_c0_g1_i1.p1  ORF type:complete len:991 (+),score=137.10 TRINITY_DN53610_c0_g1_i1:12-2984(+)
MKKSIVALGLAALVSTGALAHKHDYGVSVYDDYSRLPFAGKLAASNNQKLVQSLFPGFHATTDKLSGTPRDIYGKTLAVPGNSLTEKSQYLLNNQLRQFELVAADWKQTNVVNAPHAGYTHYKQFINGREVVFSQLSFRFTKDGMLQRMVVKTYGQPQSGTTPTLTQGDVLVSKAMNADLSEVNVNNKTVGNDWVWFPIPTQNGYVLHPAWPFTVTGTDKDDEAMPVELTGSIDAIDGVILYRSNEVKEEVNLKVVGSVYKDNFVTPATLEPLPNLAITIGSATDYTNDTGLYINSSLIPAQTAAVKLQGRWVNVKTPSGTTPSFTQVIAANGTTYTYSTASPSGDQYVNAYFHTNRMHDFMKKHYPTSTGFTSLDVVLTANVDVASATGCNAFYSGTSINFYAENSSCNSFAKIGDIIYHEYGHGINGRFYSFIKGSGGMTNGGLNEGYADVWALGVTKDPILGRGAFKSGGNIRTYNGTPKVYPYDRTSEVHANGEIIAGSWWDYSVNVGSVDSMSALFARSLYDVPDGPEGTEAEVFHEALISAILNDDDDANLSNLTPHFKEIVAAFAKHGIFLMMDAKLTHKEIAHQTTAGTPIAVAANIVCAEPAYFGSMKLIYKARKATTWDTVVLNNTGAGATGGIDFAGQIPAQSSGVIIDYFIQTYDAQGNAAYAFPTGYNPALVSNTVTLPYQFGINLRKISTTDFETTATDWQIGNSSSETAAASGRWTQAVPVASYWRPSGVSPYIQQPGNDNTTGSGSCLVTGNAASTTTVYTNADVDGGRTYAISPVISVEGMSNPIIEFYRWYGNDQGPRDSNPRSDAWQVQIKDDASSIWRNVDYTYQSDYSWRRRIFNVKDYLSSASKIQLRFIAIDDVNSSLTANGENVVEAAVDDFSVYDAFSTGVSEAAKSTFSIHPNPADQTVNVTFSAPAAGSILMYDLTGRQVASISTNAATATYSINTANLASGTYMLMLQNGTTVESHKIVVAH